MKTFTFVINLTVITITLIVLNQPASAKIPNQQEKYFDYNYDDNYSNTMREKYRNFCLKNLEKSFSSWKLL